MLEYGVCTLEYVLLTPLPVTTINIYSTVIRIDVARKHFVQRYTILLTFSTSYSVLCAVEDQAPGLRTEVSKYEDHEDFFVVLFLV